MKTIRVGTRRSMLALRQTEIVIRALAERLPELRFETVEVVTTGDRKQGTAAAAQGDKKEWVLEFEQGLVRGEIDCAVHSGKDVPIDIEAGTSVRSVMRRSTPFDVLILSEELAAQGIKSFAELPDGARIGTASLRRCACILHAAGRSSRSGGGPSSVMTVPLRGNVNTRLEKLRSGGDYDAIILAGASLERLSELKAAAIPLPPEVSLPAMNQGILAVQHRAADSEMARILAAIEDEATAAAFTAEREAIRVLHADCRSAVGMFAMVTGAALELTGRVYARDGSRLVEGMRSAPFAFGSVDESAALGHALGVQLLEQGARDLL